jgi:hypothetical protein
VPRAGYCLQAIASNELTEYAMSSFVARLLVHGEGGRDQSELPAPVETAVGDGVVSRSASVVAYERAAARSSPWC